MKKVLIGLGAVVGLLVVAVLVVPSFIDWNTYKPQISAQVERALGRQLHIDGDIDLAILPSPALAVSGVRLANIQGAQNPDMVRLEELRVKVGLRDLFGGRIAVDSVTLVRPVIALESLPDGRASWDFQPAAQDDEPAAPAAETPGEPGRQLDLALQRLTVEDGTVIYRNAAGAEERIEAVDAEISAGSLAGPFRLQGSARARGVPMTLDASVGQAGRAGSVPVNLQLALDDAAMRAQFSGSATALAADALLTGTLSMRGSDAARAMSAATGATGPAILAQAFDIDAEVSAAADSLGLNNLSLRLGDQRATGGINAALGAVTVVDVALGMTKLDLDTLLAQAETRASTSAPARATASNAAGTNGASPAAAESAFELPRNLQVAVDLSADVVQYRGGVIRDAALAAELVDGRVRVTKAGADLPGSTTLAMSGAVDAVQGQPQFDGTVSGRAADLRGLVAWLGFDTGEMPTDRLRHLQFDGKVKATPATVELNDAAVVLDTTNIRAGAVVALAARPAFGLRVVADTINLDAYMPKDASPGAVAPAETRGTAGPAGTQAASPAGSPFAMLNDFDANIDASVESLTVGGERIHKLHADVQVVRGALTIRDLSVADFVGIGGKVSGDVKLADAQPAVTLAFEATANDLARAFRFVDATPPAAVASLGQLSTKGTVKGTLDAATLQGQVHALGGSVGIDGTVQLPMGEPQLDMAVALNHPEVVKLLAAAGSDYRPAANQLGPLALKLRIKTGKDTLVLSDIDGAVGPVAVRGTVDAALDGPRPAIRANLKTSEVLLDLFLPRGSGSRASLDDRLSGTLAGGEGPQLAQAGSGASARIPWTDDPLPFGALHDADAEIDLELAGLATGDLRVEAPTLRAVLKDGRLDIERFAGALAGGSLEANGRIDGAAATPAVALNWKARQVQLAQLAPGLANFNISVQNIMQLGGKASGVADLSGDVAANGESSRALVRSLSGKGRLDGTVNADLDDQTRGTAAALGIAGAILGQQVRELQGPAAAAQYAQRLVSTFQGQNRVSGDFAIAEGQLRTDNLLVDGGTGRVLNRGSIDLPRWEIDMLSEIFTAGEERPGLTIQHYGWLDGPNRRFGGALIQRQSAPAQQPAPQPQTEVQPEQQPVQPQVPATPQDAIRDLLRGFGGR